ncbi:MAG TPA: class I SAM-dependent methyltransferase [Terriglobales bacterium]
MGILDLFRRGATAESTQRVQRKSTGLIELDKQTSGIESMTVLNLGPTSPGNISYFTNLGHGIFSEDVAAAAQEPEYYTEQDGKRVFDTKKFLDENLVPTGRRFDIALCWDVFDYVDEALLEPLAKRIYTLTKPGGYLLAFFHSKTGAGPSKYYRYHIIGPGMLEMQPGPDIAQKRTLNNRKIEDFLRDFSNVKFMLARDNIREVLAKR